MRAHRSLIFLLGTLLLGCLACKAPGEAERAGLQSRREFEYATLSGQTGMYTPEQTLRLQVAALQTRRVSP